MYASPGLGRTGRRHELTLGATSNELRSSSRRNRDFASTTRPLASPTEIPRSRSPRRRYQQLRAYRSEESLGRLPRQLSQEALVDESRRRERKSIRDQEFRKSVDATQWKLDKIKLEREIERNMARYEKAKQAADTLTASIDNLALESRTMRRSHRKAPSSHAEGSYSPGRRLESDATHQLRRSPLRRSPRLSRTERARSLELPPDATLSEAIEREMHLLKSKYNQEKDYYEGTLQDQFVKERMLQRELREEREQRFKLQQQFNELQQLSLASEASHRALRANYEELIRKNELLEKTVEHRLSAENVRLKDENMRLRDEKKALIANYDTEIQQLKYKIQVATSDLSKNLSEIDSLKETNAELNRKLLDAKETIEQLEREKSDAKYSSDLTKRLLEGELASAKTQREVLKVEKDNEREHIRELQKKLDEKQIQLDDKQKQLDDTKQKLTDLDEKLWDLETTLKQTELTKRATSIPRQVILLEDAESVLGYIEGKLLGPDSKEFTEVQKKRLARRMETLLGKNSRLERYFDSIDALIENKASLLQKILENGFELHHSILEVFKAKAEGANKIKFEELQKVLKDVASKPDEAKYFTLRSSKESIVRAAEVQIEQWARNLKGEKEPESEKRLNEILVFSAQLNQIAANAIKRNEKFQKATTEFKGIQKSKTRDLSSPKKVKAATETLENTLELYQNQQLELAQLFYGISHRLKQMLTGPSIVGKENAARELESETSLFWTAEDAFLRKFDNLLATLKYGH